MADERDGARPVRRHGRTGRVYVEWSQALADGLLARLAAGEFLYRILKEPGMPRPETVKLWEKKRPEFGAALLAARAAGGRPAGSLGPVSSYSAGIGEEAHERLCEGESLTRIGADPTMPCLSTLMRWQRERPEFAQLVAQGKQAWAERLCDEGWEMVKAATPQTAYLTHVQLSHLRWMTGVMAPRTYRLKMVEPAAPAEAQTVLFRHFRIERNPETGEDEVVAYCPNPLTGRAEREDTPGWRQAGDANTFSLPGGRTTGQGHWADEA